MVERADFAELAGLWDQRFRRHFQMQLQQPPCIHQVPNCCPCCCCCAVYLTIPSLSLSCRWTEVVSTTPFMLLCCCCCCFQQLSSMLPLQQQRQSWHCGCTSCPDSTPSCADFWHQVSMSVMSHPVTHALHKCMCGVLSRESWKGRRCMLSSRQPMQRRPQHASRLFGEADRPDAAQPHCELCCNSSGSVTGQLLQSRSVM